VRLTWLRLLRSRKSRYWRLFIDTILCRSRVRTESAIADLFTRHRNEFSSHSMHATSLCPITSSLREHCFQSTTQSHFLGFVALASASLIRLKSYSVSTRMRVHIVLLLRDLSAVKRVTRFSVIV
jgi:hypothetical protein